MTESITSRAYFFAKNAHESIDQKRKYTNEPYINHLKNVVYIVSKVPHNEIMLASAWLHDTVEDTAVTIKEIEINFGIEISMQVSMLTDISKKEDGNRIKRKNIDLVHLSRASPDAKSIKLADLIDNSNSIIKYGKDFAKIYLVEMRRLLKVLSAGDSKLFKLAKDKNDNGIKFVSTQGDDNWFYRISELYDNDLELNCNVNGI